MESGPTTREVPPAPHRDRGLSPAIFFRVAVAVFLLVVASATIVTFILPETFTSVARVHLRMPVAGTNAPGFVTTQAELLKSDAVLSNVVDALALNAAWGTKFHVEGGLQTSESVAILKGMLEVRTVPDTSIITVRVYSEQPTEAAKLANALAEVYCTRIAQTRGGVQAEIIDAAEVPQVPVRPNKPLNIALGMVVGGVLAVLAGAGAAVLVKYFADKNRQGLRAA